MSDENNLGPNKGETAEQFKDRISETEREIKRAAKAAAQPAPAAHLTPAQVPAPLANGGVPQTQNPEKKVLVTGNVELDEWLEKKGPMTLENLASSYRESEREMYRKMEEARKTQSPPVTPAPQVPPATFPPYYQYPPAQAPAYMPPPQSYPQPLNVEAMAKQYGLSPEDFERVAPLANDMAKSVINQELDRRLNPLINNVNNVNREVGRQKELVDLMADPVFKAPQVQFEMDRIFKEEPNTFVAQAQPLRYAYEKALTRIARHNLGGSTSQSTTVPEVVPPASKPPATAGGNGNGGGGAPSGSPTVMTEQTFAALSMAEKQAYLIQVGARPS